jgi:hypothetical protein
MPMNVTCRLVMIPCLENHVQHPPFRPPEQPPHLSTTQPPFFTVRLFGLNISTQCLICFDHSHRLYSLRVSQRHFRCVDFLVGRKKAACTRSCPSAGSTGANANIRPLIPSTVRGSPTLPISVEPEINTSSVCCPIVCGR